MKLETGSRVQDYRLVERLGAGSFGEVWKAAHVHLPRIVAIKFATAEGAAASLERQGIAQFGLDHAGIVKVLDASLSASPPYIVLEYVEGKSLRQLLRERGRFEIQDVSAILRQLVDVLGFAHARGVVHGDLKPENVIVIERGVEKVVKVTDFQLGGFAGGDRPAPAGADGVRPSLKTAGPRGTYHYLAPEQELGEALDGRADLFALGVVLFEMATGTLPQGRDLPSDVNPALSWWWDHVFSRCYTGRDRRYRSAEEVAKDLAVAGTGPQWGEMPSQKAGRSGAAPGAESGPPFVIPRDVLAAAYAEANQRAYGPARRASPWPALAVGFMALLIPAVVLHSVGRLDRCGSPYAPRAAVTIIDANGLEPEAQGIANEYAMALSSFQDARRPYEQRLAFQKMESVRRDARLKGFIVEEDGKVIRFFGGGGRR